MMSIKLSKRQASLVSTILMIGLFLLLILAFGAYQSIALAAPNSADPLAPGSDQALQGAYYSPPAVAPVEPEPEKRCKIIVGPPDNTITLGEPFEVCWLGNKNSTLRVGPATLSPDGSEYYTKPDGKGLVCHMYTVNPGELPTGNFYSRCLGEQGTIFATYWNVVLP